MSDQTILIECKLRRKGGTFAEIGGTTYHFAPDNQDRHVAAVSDPDHIARFLSITEAYRMAAGAQAKAAAPAQGIAAPVTPEPEKTEVQAEKPAPVQIDTNKALEDMTSDELRAVFSAEIGREAHPKAKDATMISQIEAMREEKAGKA